MVSWSDVGDFFLGEDPRKVRGPTGLEDTMGRRRSLGEMFETAARGEQPSQAERALGMEALRQSEEIAARQQSMAAGRRGFGALSAGRQAASNVAQSQQALAGDVAAAMARQRAADIAEGRRGFADVLTDEERAQYELAQWQQANASPGLLPALTSLGGAAIGGYFGGPEGARAGGQLGGAAAQPFMRRY